MSAGNIAMPRRFGRVASPALAAAFRPVHLVINVPVAAFLAALAAMLFRPPDLKVFPFDRVAFVLLILVFALRLCMRLEWLQTYSATWPMLGLAFLGVLNAIHDPDTTQAWSVLAAKWIVPFVLFHFAASIFRRQKSLRKLEIFSLIALSYLTFISVMFLFDLKFLIYPCFIINESIGIHTDRARGPLLQAVANGVCLTVLGIIALDCYRRRTLRGIWALILFLTVPLALLATRTRAVWLSAAVAVSYLAIFGHNSRLRRPALAMCSIAVAVICGAWLWVSDTDALHDRLLDRSPVEFRLDMYRAGWQMFLEKPIAGWGGEAITQPEIERRISNFHPERYLFHNTYLELAVERGLIGTGLYAWLMICLFRLARWQHEFPDEAHFLDSAFRQLWPVIVVVYLINASAVVMNYQFVNGFIFTIAGILAGQERSHKFHAAGI